VLTDRDYKTVLRFSDSWFTLGIVDNEELRQIGAAFETSDDKNDEHYRYGAFLRFLRKHRPVSMEMAEALYDLGDSDPDYGMGGSIMHQIVILPECPEVVKEKALLSDRKHLVRIVQRERLVSELQGEALDVDLFTRCLESDDHIIHWVLLEHPALSSEQRQALGESGANQGIRNKALGLGKYAPDRLARKK
jgi:hypothetical protein